MIIYILGIMAGVGVGYFGSKLLINYQNRKMIREAREKLRKQNCVYVLNGKQYDLEKDIENKTLPQEKPLPSWSQIIKSRIPFLKK